MSVIVVDDDPDLQEIVKTYVSWQDRAVLATAVGLEEAKELPWNDATLAIIDYQLPDGNGEMLCVWLAEAHPNVIRVMLTGRPELLRDPGIAHHAFSKLDLRGKEFTDVVRRFG